MPRNRDIRADAVAIYIRWSTDEQGEGTTLEVQRERCSLFARSQGWTVREDLIFVDEGYSGATLNRPGMERLRQAIQDGLVECVITYKLDRLSRNLMDTVMLVRQEWAGKCIYRSATEGFDTSDDSPVGGLIFNILASFAEFERAVIKDRTQAGMRRRMNEGMYMSGTVPHGYERVGKGQLVVDPGEAAVIKRIFQLVTEHMVLSGVRIARQLNEEGYRTRTGGKWRANTVERILRNPLYVGDVIYGRRNLPPTTLGGIGRHAAGGDIIAASENAVPAIISREVFEKAHALMTSRKLSKPHPANRARDEYLLTSIARCKCGGSVGVVVDRRGARWYRCGRRSEGIGCSEGGVAFPGDPVEQRIVAALRERFGGPGRKEALTALRRNLGANQRRLELEAAIKAVERRKAEVLTDLARLRRQTRQGELTPSTYEELKRDAESEMRDLEEQTRSLTVQFEAAGREETNLERLERLMDSLDQWEDLTPRQRKEILRGLCERLVVYRPSRERQEVEVEVKWVG